MKKFSKTLTVFALAILMLMPNTVYASDIGWPVETTDVQAEEIPQTTESYVDSGAALSATDSSTTGMQDYEIFGEEYD